MAISYEPQFDLPVPRARWLQWLLARIQRRAIPDGRN
jgi:hypothetical protein